MNEASNAKLFAPIALDRITQLYSLQNETQQANLRKYQPFKPVTLKTCIINVDIKQNHKYFMANAKEPRNKHISNSIDNFSMQDKLQNNLTFKHSHSRDSHTLHDPSLQMFSIT